MEWTRSSGILLHPTSLPGSLGIGDLGPRAHAFVDFLHEAGCGLWQMLPLGPTGFDNSPYQSFSAFAGNPYLISPESLAAEGLLSKEELEAGGRLPRDRVDFCALIPWKQALLDSAFHRFRSAGSSALREEFEAFRAREGAWLEDYALFMALKEVSDGKRWDDWDEPVRLRRREALEEARRAHEERVEGQAFLQFLFFRQWESLRRHALEKRVRLIGDVPIFVASDSADVWGHSELFHLDEAGKPTVVAGVPPDYFSKTGQLWGNPLYRWGAHAESDYAWWASRLRAALALVDWVRLDHFRGFSACWEVPAKSTTAEQGRWSPGPGTSFLGKMKERLGDLPLIAEDLGVITPEVLELRDAFGLPGMKVLQFAFSGPDNPFLPHAIPRHCVAYTGTHDNDTSRGWFEAAPEAERDFCRRYLVSDGKEIAWDLIRAAWASPAAVAIAPMQDFLNLDGSARMNFPGRPSGSWGWRMPEGAAGPDLASRLREINFLYQRTRPAVP